MEQGLARRNGGRDKVGQEDEALAMIFEDLSLVQNHGNVRSSEEVMQCATHELSQRRGGLKGNAAKPSLLVKGEHTADMIEITNHLLHPVMPQVASHLWAATREKASCPDQQVMG